MQRTDLAPVLSATSNRDSVWIISIFPTCTRRQQPQRTSQGLQISQSVLGPSSAPQTICSTSRWAETPRFEREAHDYCKVKAPSQALITFLGANIVAPMPRRRAAGGRCPTLPGGCLRQQGPCRWLCAQRGTAGENGVRAHP